MKVFSSVDLYAQLKRIRNKIRKHYPLEIIDACVSRLNDPKATEIERIVNIQPWILLLLIKWTIQYGEYTAPDRRHFLKRDFVTLYNLAYDLSGMVRLPSEYENYQLFFRNIAYQQFWLQEQSVLGRLARQRLLFSKLPRNHPFQKKFLESTGVSIGDFIELSFTTISRFLGEHIVVTEEWFSPLNSGYPEGTVATFLNAISATLSELQEYLSRPESKMRSIAYEFYEQSPLKRYPLFESGGKYYPFSKDLLFSSLETFVYDLLRDLDPSRFMDKFGKQIFEQYLQLGLEYGGIHFEVENELSLLIPTNSKLVDFFVYDNPYRVFIEAKGVEMATMGMLTHIPEVVKDKAKSNVIKAIKQGYSVAKAITPEKGDFNKNFLLVVTAKDLCLQNGRVLYGIARDDLVKLVESYGGHEVIPFKHIYFISIDEFDFLIYLIRKGNRLSAILKHAVEADSDPQKEKFSFIQHLLDYDPSLEYPEYLVNEIDAIMLRLKEKFHGEAG